MPFRAASITIRPVYAQDDPAVARLAMLDSAELAPPAPLLVAEVDGVLRAALSLEDGSAVADPFFLTTDLLTLLRTQAATSAAARRRQPLHRLRYALGQVMAHPPAPSR